MKKLMPSRASAEDALFDFASPSDLQAWLLDKPPLVSSSEATDNLLPVEN